jgi:hypothetical protein
VAGDLRARAVRGVGVALVDIVGAKVVRVKDGRDLALLGQLGRIDVVVEVVLVPRLFMGSPSGRVEGLVSIVFLDRPVAHLLPASWEQVQSIARRVEEGQLNLLLLGGHVYDGTVVTKAPVNAPVLLESIGMAGDEAFVYHGT